MGNMKRYRRPAMPALQAADGGSRAHRGNTEGTGKAVLLFTLVQMRERSVQDDAHHAESVSGVPGWAIQSPIQPKPAKCSGISGPDSVLAAIARPG
jgi:hypothetical protein